MKKTVKKHHKQHKKTNKESIMTRIKNWSISILLAAAMLYGLQCFSSTSSLKFAQLSDVHYYTGQNNTTYKMIGESPELLDDAIEQAKRDSTEKQLPAVFHRKNNKKWKVTMELSDWIKLYNEYYSSRKLEEREVHK